MRANHGENSRNPVHVAYAYAVYELGSAACVKSDAVRRFVIGDVPATQWRVVETPANAANLVTVTRRQGGHPQLTEKPANMRNVAVVSASAEAIRAAAKSGDVPAVAFRAIGNILVAGEIATEPDADGNYVLGMRFAQDDDRPDWGGLEVAIGNLHTERRRFVAAQTGTHLLEAQISLAAFTDGGRYEAVILQ